MRGSADMVAFIHRDEETHLALFQNMIRTFVSENPNLPWFMIRPKVNKMFDDAYKLEVSWLKYVSDGLFSDQMIENTVAYFCKKRAKAIHMYDEVEDRFGHGEQTPLTKKLESFGSFNDTKTNFFEGNVKNYSMGSLEWEEDAMGDVPVPSVEETWVMKQPTYEEACGNKTSDQEAVDRSDECVGCQ